ncbi:MAG: T9SS type A sorting domain-containing protein, partial [Panacibacter sp.]
IAKISSTGLWQFSKELHNYNNAFLESGVGNPDRLAVDNSNNVYAVMNLAGNYPRVLGDTVPIDKTSAYLVKLDNGGNLIWHKGFGSNETKPNSIHFANNALYISGRIRNYVNAGYLWYFSDLYVNPSSPFAGGAYWEYFVAKANTTGDFQWVSSFSGDDVSFLPESFAVKAFGTNIYTSGYYRGNINSLGNLNSKYTGDASKHNIFFGKLKDQYIKVGAVSASEVVPGCIITIPFTSNGLTFSAGNSFIAELSDINWEFTNPIVIGSVISTGNGVINATIPASLPFGTSGYKIRIRSTDTLLTGLNYYAYADTAYTIKVLCPTPSAGFAATNITNASATVNWASVACGAGYRVQYRVKGAGAWITATTITNNNTTSYTLSGLTANTTYQWRIATRCRSNGVVSFSAYTTAKQFKTAVALIASSADAMKINGQATMIVQPNPSTDNAILSVKGNVKNATVSIVDFVGKTVWRKNGINNGQLTLPVQHLAAGIYLVKLVNGNETKIVKLVKQ